MTHADAFLRDILAHPDDDAPRLIFADWLEEQGDAESVARAEFIRVQCALAAGQVSPQQRAELVRREQQILNEWGAIWEGLIRLFVHIWAFHRGFVDEVSMFSDTFLKQSKSLFRYAPIQHLHLVHRPSHTPFSISEMAKLADNTHLRNLHSLDLSDNQLESRHVRALVVSEHLTNLTELNVSHNRIGDSGIRALAGSPLLSRLEHLNLRSNDVGTSGLRALALALEKIECSPEGLRLRWLDLNYPYLSAPVQRAIAESPLLRRLVCK